MAPRRFNRIIIVVFDSLGVGALPDAGLYGDEGSNTLLHTDQKFQGGLRIPHLEKLGLKNLVGLGREKNFNSVSFRLKESSNGKDTTTGHWEMMGLVLEKAFETFPSGFPEDLMQKWSALTGFGFLGNRPASGTVIMDELGEEHIKSGKPIVYTSADSVFQIAAHERHFGLKKLYDLCEKTRAFLNESPFKIGRVIARPFQGEPGNFARTENRYDYAVTPYDPTVLDRMKKAQFSVVGVGKIPSIFNQSGVTKVYESHNDRQSIDATLQAIATESQEGVIFSNLNDLDMLYGHRRDAQGYGRQLEFIDTRIPDILSKLRSNDLILFTADHGTDPTFKGTDHTREYTPLLAYSPGLKADRGQKEDRETFADIGQTILENFGLERLNKGKSFLENL